ncbi:CBS domain-containing protein [Desulfohalovibrio reitneri]|uniref:CBS domain-containing protein n=1 Tax=Desulfohalovibrio reitneri TaxID=1307759 RepID=UPI0004A6C505|nr:CBS domain-containing protein [Desulfohalovibrio reitneri]
MLQRKRAWDVMREDFFAVEEDADLGSVMDGLRERLKEQPEAHLVIVCGRGGRLRGVVTAWDALRTTRACLQRDEELEAAGEKDWEAAFSRACKECREVPVRKLINRDAPIVKPSDQLQVVLDALVESRRNWVVVEEGGKPIGVILIGDLFREITREMTLPR